MKLKKTFKEIVQIAGSKYEITDERIYQYYHLAKYGKKATYIKDKNQIIGVRFNN